MFPVALLRVNVLQSTVYVQGMSGGGAEGNAYTCTGRQTDRHCSHTRTHTHTHTHTHDQHDPSLLLQPAKLSKWQGRALTLAINPKAVFVISRDPSVRLRTVDKCPWQKCRKRGVCVCVCVCVCVYNTQYTVSVLHVSVALPGASPGVPPGRFELGCGQ